MKHFLKYKNLFATVAIAMLLAAPWMQFVSIAHADVPVPGTNDPRLNVATPQSLSSTGNFVGGSQDNGQLATNPNQITSSQVNGQDSISCFEAGNGVGGILATCISSVVYVFTVGIGTGFAYVSAYFFDWAIQLSLNSLAYSQQFVSQMWTTVRDIANMFFLFIILYLAFTIMFQAETSRSLSMLLRVIAIAFIINFSFFGVRFVIDAGNIVAIQFYNSINAPSISASAANTTGVQGVVVNRANALSNVAGSVGWANTKDLTASIMGMLQMQTLFSLPSFQAWQGQNPGFLVTLITLTFLYVAAGIMFWILTVTFATAGVKFILRIVALWVLIIASPIALIMGAVTDFKGGLFKRWVDELISNTFYPAIFMFIFLMLTIFANQMSCAGATAGASCNGLINGIFYGLSTNNQGSTIGALGLAVANVGIRLGIVVAILWVALAVSRGFKTFGSQAAEKFGGWAGRMYTSGMGRLGGGLARQTIGLAGDRYAKSDTGRRLAAEGLLGRTAWRVAGATGRQSFDVRGGLNALGIKKETVGAPSGQGGFTAAFEKRVKEREEESKKLKPSDTRLADATKSGIQTALKNSKLSNDEKKELANLAKNYVDTKKAAADGDATNADVKVAKKLYNDAVQQFKKDGKLDLGGEIKKAVEAAGKKNPDLYADSLKGSFLSLPYASFGDKEAAKSIRGKKTDQEHVKDILESMGIKPDDDYDPTPPPTTPSGGGGNKPKGDGGAAGAVSKNADNVIIGPWPGSGTTTSPNNSKLNWSIFSSNENREMGTLQGLMREQLKEIRSQTNTIKTSLEGVRAAVSNHKVNPTDLAKNIGQQISKNIANENAPSVSDKKPVDKNKAA